MREQRTNERGTVAESQLVQSMESYRRSPAASLFTVWPWTTGPRNASLAAAAAVVVVWPKSRPAISDYLMYLGEGRGEGSNSEF